MKYKEMVHRIFGRVSRIWRDPSLFLVAVIGPISLFMLIITPPFQAPDEHTHFLKAVQLSEGRVVGKFLGVLPGYPLPLVGDLLPAKYKITSDHYIGLRVHLNKKADVKQIRTDFSHPATDTRRIPTPFENTVVYPPLAYLPQALVIAVVNVFNKTPLVQLYAARIVVLAVSLLLLFLAVRRIPFGKWALVALVATPMSLLLMGSCAGDAMTMGLGALFIAHVLAATVKREKLSRTDIVWLGALAVALGCCKSPYQLLVLFVLAVPSARFVSRRSYYKTLAATILVPLLVAGLWALLVKKLYLNIVIDSDTAYQTQYVLHHPLNFIHVLLSTYFGAAGDYTVRGFIDLSAGPSAPLPLWFVVADLLLIAMLITQEPVRQSIVRRLKCVRFVALAVLALVFMMLNTLLYITFTPVTKPLIDGMQGRYFIPISYLLVPLLGGVQRTDEARYVRLLSVFRCFVVFTALVTYLALLRRYY